MNDASTNLSPETRSTALALATVVRTNSGVEFDASADRWAYKDEVVNVCLNFDRLRQRLSSELVDNAKLTLCWYAAEMSPTTLMTLYKVMLNFVSSSSSATQMLSRITTAHLISYKVKSEEARNGYFGILAAFLKKWHSLGYEGVGADVFSLLKQLRIKGNEKGVAVLTMDPEQGPFTSIEMDGLHAALNTAYAEGRVKTADYVMAWLSMLLGQRTIQYAAMKVCDVKMKRDADGNINYSVMMPRAKKRRGSLRVEMRNFPLVEQFGEILVEYAKSVRKSFEGVLTDTLQAPLFPASKGDRGSAGYEFHKTNTNVGGSLKKILQGLSVQSERTGLIMNVNARRFRRTLATRAAEEGHGPLVIAALLDHADTQSVGIYSANSHTIIERIDRAIAMDMAPLAQAFSGTLVDSSVEGAASAKRIIDLRVDRSGKAMGKCGKDGSCGFAAPIACYTCKSFIAWLDGPHEAVLAFLLARREKLLQTTDKRMAAVNDRTILAVAAVIICINEIIIEELMEGGEDYE
jgi:integrase